MVGVTYCPEGSQVTTSTGLVKGAFGAGTLGRGNGFVTPRYGLLKGPAGEVKLTVSLQGVLTR